MRFMDAEAPSQVSQALGCQKLRKRKSRAVASTLVRAAGSGSTRAIATAPSVLERYLSLARRPGIKGSIRFLYFVSSPRILGFVAMPACDNAGARATSGHAGWSVIASSGLR